MIVAIIRIKTFDTIVVSILKSKTGFSIRDSIAEPPILTSIIAAKLFEPYVVSLNFLTVSTSTLYIFCGINQNKKGIKIGQIDFSISII